MRAGLRLIQLRNAEMEALRRDIQERLEPPLLEGVESGEAAPLTKKDMKKVRRTVKKGFTKQKK